MEEQSQEKVWDKLAEKWHEYRKNTVYEVLDFLKGKKGKILDMGCGSGRNIIKLSGVEWYGVDFSGEMLKIAERDAKAKNIKAVFFKSTLEKLPFEDNSFGYVTFISTLHCIEKKSNRKKALKELFRVLKKNREAVISVWDKQENPKLHEMKAKEGYVNWKYDGKNYRRYYYFYTHRELVKLLEEVGFKILKVESKSENKTHSKKNIVVYVRK